MMIKDVRCILLILIAGLSFPKSLHAQQIYCSGQTSTSVEYGDSVDFQIEVLAYDAPIGVSVNARFGGMGGRGDDSDFEILTPNFYTSESGRGPGYGYCNVRFRPIKNYLNSVTAFIDFTSNGGFCEVEVTGIVIHPPVGGRDSMTTEYFSKIYSDRSSSEQSKFSIFSTYNENEIVTFKISPESDTVFSISPDTLYLEKHGEASGTLRCVGSHFPRVSDTLFITYHSTVDSSVAVQQEILTDSSIYYLCIGDVSDFGGGIELPLTHDTLLTFQFANGTDTQLRLAALTMIPFDSSEFDPIQLQDSILNPGKSGSWGPPDTCICLFRPNLHRILENDYDNYYSGKRLEFLGACKPSNLLSCPDFYSSWSVGFGHVYNPSNGGTIFDDTLSIRSNYYPAIAFETDLDTTIVECYFSFENDSSVGIFGSVPISLSLADSSQFRILSFDTSKVINSQSISCKLVHLEMALIAPTEGTYSTYLIGHFQSGEDSRSEVAAYRIQSSLVRAPQESPDFLISSDGTSTVSVGASRATSLDCYDILGRLILHRQLQPGSAEITLPDEAHGALFFRFSYDGPTGKPLVKTRKILIQ